MQKRVQRCTTTREKYRTKPKNGGIDYAQNRGIDSNIVLVLIWLWFLASGLSFRPGGGISNIYDTFRLVESPLELDWRIVDERPKQGRLEFWWNKTGFARRRTVALAVPMVSQAWAPTHGSKAHGKPSDPMVSQAWAQTHGSKAHGKPSAPSVPFCSFPTALRAGQGRCIIGQVFPEANTARRTVKQG